MIDTLCVGPVPPSLSKGVRRLATERWKGAAPGALW